MSQNRGKNFELKLRTDLKKCFPNSFIFRLNDQLTGYKVTSQNPCDFILFTHGKLFLLEAKSHSGASLPFSCITQYERLLQYENIPNLYRGVVLWLPEKDIVMYIPITTITKMKKDGKKSVGLKAIEEGYNIKIIPSIKKRIYLDSDYSCLVNLHDGE